MIENLRRLVRLQDLMLSIDALNEKIAAVPVEVARLEKDLLAVDAEVVKEKAALGELQKERRRLEMELMGVETRIQKYQSQLADVKTNKEYQAILHEIEGARRERAALDEKILLDMEESEKGSAASRALEDRLKEKRRATDEGKKSLAARLESLKIEKAAADRDREAIEKTVPAPFLDPFQKVARQRKGRALVPVQNELCGGCHVRVMPKLIQEVRRGNTLIACDSCKRWLYVLEDVAAGQPVAVPAAGTPDAPAS